MNPHGFDLFRQQLMTHFTGQDQGSEKGVSHSEEVRRQLAHPRPACTLGSHITQLVCVMGIEAFRLMPTALWAPETW